MYASLDNKQIGQSIAKLRNHREIKASEIAKFVHLSPAAYTKYERGETAITINFLNQVAQFFDVDPFQLLQNSPKTIIENVHSNSNVAINYSNLSAIDMELLKTWSVQIAEKDEQIKQLLLLLSANNKAREIYNM
jgi:transcriptional regulator with XRE-family HTH domain